MLAKSPIGEGWTGALAGEFLPHPDQFATVDLRTDDSRQHASPVDCNDLDLPIFMIIDTASKNFLAGNVAQCGDVEPIQAGGRLDTLRWPLWLSCHWRNILPVNIARCPPEARKVNLAEGEELGSNLLHVGQSTPASSCVRSSWQRRGQGHHEPEAPPPLVGNLHHPFWVKSQWRKSFDRKLELA